MIPTNKRNMIMIFCLSARFRLIFLIFFILLLFHIATEYKYGYCVNRGIVVKKI